MNFDDKVRIAQRRAIGPWQLDMGPWIQTAAFGVLLVPRGLYLGQ